MIPDDLPLKGKEPAALLAELEDERVEASRVRDRPSVGVYGGHDYFSRSRSVTWRSSPRILRRASC